MRIVMNKNTRGSDDPMGRFVKTYEKGEFYDMNEPWQVSLAETFVATHRAREVAVADATVYRETKDGVSDADDSRLTSSSKWSALLAAAKKLPGKTPRDKPSVLKILRKAGLLSE